MTPAQQQALEALIGRGLTSEELDALEAPVLARNDSEVARILSAGCYRLQSRYIGTGTILAVMKGKGGQFLDTLVQVGQTNRDAYWSLDLIKLGRFDIGEVASQAQIDGLIASFPQFTEGLEDLKKLGQEQNSIHFDAVSTALNIAMGIRML